MSVIGAASPPPTSVLPALSFEHDADHRGRGHARPGAPVVLFPTRIVGGGVDVQSV